MIARLPRIDKLTLLVTWTGVICREISTVGNHIYMMRHTHTLCYSLTEYHCTEGSCQIQFTHPAPKSYQRPTVAS
jgi:hypothetical protein